MFDDGLSTCYFFMEVYINPFLSNVNWYLSFSQINPLGIQLIIKEYQNLLNNKGTPEPTKDHKKNPFSKFTMVCSYERGWGWRGWRVGVIVGLCVERWKNLLVTSTISFAGRQVYSGIVIISSYSFEKIFLSLEWYAVQNFKLNGYMLLLHPLFICDVNLVYGTKLNVLSVFYFCWRGDA